MPHAPTEIAGRDLDAALFQQQVVEACRPVVIRGLVADWPVVKAARGSPRALQTYLAAFDAGGRVEVFFGNPAIGGKYYYNPGLQGFNFERRTMKLIEGLDCVLEAVDHPSGQSVYVGSVPTAESLPGFAADNPMPLARPSGNGSCSAGTAGAVCSISAAAAALSSN